MFGTPRLLDKHENRKAQKDKVKTEKIENQILQALKNGPLNTRSLLEIVHGKTSEIMSVLKEIVGNSSVKMVSDGKSNVYSLNDDF